MPGRRHISLWDRVVQAVRKDAKKAGILAILLIIVGYVAFDKLTPKLDFDDLLNKGNLALAVVIGSFILGLCYVVGRVVSAVLG